MNKLKELGMTKVPLGYPDMSGFLSFANFNLDTNLYRSFMSENNLTSITQINTGKYFDWLVINHWGEKREQK